MKSAGTCPTCKGERKAASTNVYFPFCSARCKLADLSNWFEGRYSVAAEPVDPEAAQDPEDFKRWN